MTSPHGTGPYLQNEGLPSAMEGEAHQLIVEGRTPEALARTDDLHGPKRAVVFIGRTGALGGADDRRTAPLGERAS